MVKMHPEFKKHYKLKDDKTGKVTSIAAKENPGKGHPDSFWIDNNIVYGCFKTYLTMAADDENYTMGTKNSKILVDKVKGELNFNPEEQITDAVTGQSGTNYYMNVVNYKWEINNKTVVVSLVKVKSNGQYESHLSMSLQDKNFIK